MRAFRAFEVETIAYLVSKLWQLLPHDVNQQNTIQILKKELDIGFAMNGNVEYAKTFFTEVGYLIGQALSNWQLI